MIISILEIKLILQKRCYSVLPRSLHFTRPANLNQLLANCLSKFDRCIAAKSLQISPAVRCLYWSKTQLKMFLSLLTSFYATFQCGGYNVFEKNLIFFFAPENVKKPPSKFAHNWPRPFLQYCQFAQIKPKYQFLLHKNLPPRDFSIMTLYTQQHRK